MKPTLFAVVVFVVTLGAMADDTIPKGAKSKAIKLSLQTFAGTWEIVAVQPPVSTQGAKYLVFRNDMTYAALDADNNELWAGTFDLDPTATPKVWDHRSNESQKTGGDALGIYELDGDTLKVCCVVGTWRAKRWAGKPRPAKFSLPEADVVLELRRVKAGEQSAR